MTRIVVKIVLRKDKNMIQSKNDELKKEIKKLNLKYWEVADCVGITDSTFSRWLRTPLNDDRKQRVISAIKELTKEIHA